jgi:5-methylcytosine-specific restriction endonuclease McrA
MPISKCKNCEKEYKHSHQVTGVYCSIACTKEGQKKERRQNFLEGKIVGRGHLKGHMLDIHGRECMMCHNTEWLGDPIPLELDHIDGNAGNNYPNNLRLLCPNCHAKTPTHKAKNKGNGRGSRGLPWY